MSTTCTGVVLSLTITLGAAGAVEQPHAGGGPVEVCPSGHVCLSSADHANIALGLVDYETNVGALSSLDIDSAPPPFPVFPIAGNLRGDLLTLNYTDLDPSSEVLDWDCTNFTYDGHSGNDTLIRSFAEQAIGVPIIAARDGVVVVTHDGEDDMHVECAGVSNLVVIDHGYGQLALYGHLKNASLLVSTGDQVVAGQQLALTASSGCSSWPHLHFEIWESGNVMEPFAGTCHPETTRWRDQIPVNRDMYLHDFGLTHEGLATTHPASGYPRDGQIALDDPLVSVWFTVTNLPAAADRTVRFIRPDGTVALDDVASFDLPGAAAFSVWWWSFDVEDMHEIVGTWRVVLLINDTVMVDSPFEVREERTDDFNRPPVEITAAYTPMTPTDDMPLSCDVDAASLVLDDPDFDVVRYEYVWTVNGDEQRRITSAAQRDVLPRNMFDAGDLVECSVTPMDDTTSGPGALVSALVVPASEMIDCNGNGFPDTEDITLGTSADANDDGVPDECAAPVIYVNASASGNNHGTTWLDAYTDLVQALHVAETRAAQTPEAALPEIWVASGTYTPDGGSGNRARAFELVDGVFVYGGFAGEETDRDQRDPAANLTVLSGDLLGDDAPGFTGTDENSYHVVSALAVTDGGLDGVTITGGNADRLESSVFTGLGYLWSSFGGGIFVQFVAPTFSHCRIEHNAAGAGGGVLTLASDVVFHDCHIANNRAFILAGSAGGGVAILGGRPRLDGCVIADNASNVGGGVFASADPLQSTWSEPLFVNCLFIANAVEGLGSVPGLGAGLAAEFTDATIVNSTFVANDAAKRGGAMATWGECTLAGCILWDNDAAFGDELSLEAGIVHVDYSNVADADGDVWAGAGVVDWGSGNLHVDPRFADPANDVYTLRPGSPAIDAGDNTALPPGNDMDLAGAPRFVDDPDTADTGLPDGARAVVDMGSYEFQPIPCGADLDDSGDVGLTDLLHVLADWGPCPGCAADLDGDGVIGFTDLLRILARWGPCV